MTIAVRTVAAIDQESADLTAKIKPGAAALEQARTTAAALEEKRRGVLIAARIDGDAKALKQLETYTPKLDRAALEVRDGEAVLEEIHTRLKALRGANLVAQRRELQAVRTAAANQQLKLSGPLDTVLADLVEQCGEWLALSLAQYQACADLNEPSVKTPKQQLAWVLETALHPLAPNHFKKPSLHVTFSDLAERFADPAPAEQDEERKSA